MRAQNFDLKKESSSVIKNFFLRNQILLSKKWGLEQKVTVRSALDCKVGLGLKFVLGDKLKQSSNRI